MQPARIRTPVLDVAYEASGPADGLTVLLLHGFPYDVRSFDGVVALVNAAGFRTIVPWLRGYGGTQFLSADTQRSGEQAALGQDLLELMDALRIQKAVLGGYDWGGRAACVVSALWPERVAGLVSCTGYNVHDIANSHKPADPAQEARFWYQYYFHTERGRNGLTGRASACQRRTRRPPFLRVGHRPQAQPRASQQRAHGGPLAGLAPVSRKAHLQHMRTLGPERRGVRERQRQRVLPCPEGLAEVVEPRADDHRPHLRVGQRQRPRDLCGGAFGVGQMQRQFHPSVPGR